MSVEMNEPQLSEVDHRLLAALLIEHMWRTDHGKTDTIHELFVEDGEISHGLMHIFEGGAIRQTSGRKVGRDAIRTWGQAHVADRHRIAHVCTNVRFTADGPDGAQGTSTLTLYQATSDGSPTTVPKAVGEYSIRCVRAQGGWRFASIHFDPLFERDVQT